MKQKKLYGIVNGIILLTALVLFGYRFWSGDTVQKLFQGYVGYAMIGIALLVYGIKALRLYFILLGQGISVPQFLKQYCKVIPVSVIYPYKLGELFRIYCYGHQISNFWNATVCSLLDRFIDTIALVCVLLSVAIYNKTAISGILYVLLVFLAVVILAYFVFPELYLYWKKYFLMRPASKRGIAMLELLEKMQETYLRIQMIAKGKYVILFALSLLAWGIEIGGIGLMGGEILPYLTSALTGTGNPLLQQYVMISVLLMLAVYVVLHMFMWMRERGARKC